MYGLKNRFCHFVLINLLSCSHECLLNTKMKKQENCVFTTKSCLISTKLKEFI